jgi:hypothetical protein
MLAGQTENSPSARHADYFPIKGGRYSVEPGLREFGTDFGNGIADQQVFQIDEEFDEYRRNKLEVREERLSKYYRTHMFSADVSSAILRFIIERLALEHPDLFKVSSDSVNNIAIDCKLTEEKLVLDSKMRLLRVEREGDAPQPDYHDALDALACQIQEDLAIVSKSPFGRDWLAAVHLCHANKWAAEEKIGQPFQVVHQPVAGMRNSKRDAETIVSTIVNKGPFVRFAWGLTTDASLNQHPRSSLTAVSQKKDSEEFDPASPSLYMRVERQVLWPFPQQQAALFTIRTYLTDCNEIRADRHRKKELTGALKSMTGEQLKYKGIDKNLDAILGWFGYQDRERENSAQLRNAIRHLYRRW